MTRQKALLIFLISFISEMNSQTCKGLQEGVFQNHTEFGQFIMERKGDFQLEKSIEYGIVYLNKIEKINDCEYFVRRYKIIKEGILPAPNMNDSVKVDIYNAENNTYYYSFKLIGTEISIKGKFIKISDDISDDFKDLILNEKN